MTTKYALEAIGLTKRFGDTDALVDLNLSVQSGEVVCLLGANGAGKTTTINLFLGFLTPDAGKAFVANVDVAKSPFEARRKLAYLPESVAMYPKLTGVENLAFFDRLAAASGRTLSTRRSWLKPVFRRRHMTIVRRPTRRECDKRSVLRSQWRVSRKCFCWTNRCRGWIRRPQTAWVT